MRLIDALVHTNYSWKVANISGCSIQKTGNNFYYVRATDDVVTASYPSLEECLKIIMQRFPSEFMDDKWYVAGL
jgi:hypothetical protein